MCMYILILCVPGLLEAPTALHTKPLTSTHDVLMWEDPYTLNLTDIEPDITDYTVTILMEDPPPSYPYDLSVTLDQLTATSNQTVTIGSGSQQFSFPRYTFPVWLSVRAENPVGLGEMSQYYKYTADIPDGCMRIHGEAV